jgi:hypothetical protein
MTKEEKIDLVEKRIRFLSVWKEICNRRKAFEPMKKIFQLLEADYDRCLIPTNDTERIYRFFKPLSSDEKIIATKLGKYLVKNYKEIVPADHILSDFVASLNAVIWKEPPSIVVYKGEDIITAYERCNHSKGVSSCMTKEGRHINQKFLALNPDKVELHCYEDVENIYARVLVWTVNGGRKVVDRIYPNKGDHYHNMLEHFEGLNNHYIRENHNAPHKHDMIPINDLVDPFVIMKGADLETYPYLDTFRYGVIIGDEIILTNKICTNPVTNLAFDSQYGYYTEIK